MTVMRAVAATLGLVVALAAAGPAVRARPSAPIGDGIFDPPAAGRALGPSETVLIGESFFDPASVTINQGDSVTWTVGAGRHTVTADNGAFDSGPIGEGQTFSCTF